MTNRTAFLDTISFSEGTLGIGDDGYNVLFGTTANHPKLFTSYADHPRVRTYETHDEFINNDKMDYTTAAGRYQIIKGMFDAYKKRLNLPDFSPASQDSIALQMIKERRALYLIDGGMFDSAVFACSKIWASFPGSDCIQPKRKLVDLRAFYLSRGGVVA